MDPLRALIAPTRIGQVACVQRHQKQRLQHRTVAIRYPSQMTARMGNDRALRARPRSAPDLQRLEGISSRLDSAACLGVYCWMNGSCCYQN